MTEVLSFQDKLAGGPLASPLNAAPLDVASPLGTPILPHGGQQKKALSQDSPGQHRLFTPGHASTESNLTEALKKVNVPSLVLEEENERSGESNNRSFNRKV